MERSSDSDMLRHHSSVFLLLLPFYMFELSVLSVSNCNVNGVTLYDIYENHV